ncbi:putative small GTPase superfamily, ARF/SAR type, P-loop containing nucleoside triphosphate hydrolase [Rosa chinensis]|uniref:Putative small GTPase superfamily, ARF/SAR type, P-loop containing nucleoside triphosphate hydrolase n=1 Tax=Rosa chinensis TaxID=74649 RepID=A0A2P6PB68_ROSCH|nr:putative small GTPase superfamily, ARF/SAR type, P-loop containing nucleoside triphosphate hydrolase [Rosa chinensis]
MGAFISKFWFMLFPVKKNKIVVVELDNAGKTTTPYKLHLGKAITTNPTIGSKIDRRLHGKHATVELMLSLWQ